VSAQVPQGPGRGGPRGGDRDRGGRGRDGRPGGRGRRDDRGPSTGGHRVVAELSTLEKALGKSDLEGQLRPLDEVVRQLRSLRVRALAEVDPTTRGRLITTLLRVSRQPRPSGEPAAAGAEAPPEQEAKAAEPEVAPEPAAPVESPQEAAELPELPAAEDMAPGEVPPAAEAPAEAAPGDAPAEPATADTPEASSTAPLAAAPGPAQLYSDVLYRVGLAWLAVHEAERAEGAFAAAGRTPSREELARAEAAPAEKAQRPDAGGTRRPGERGPRKPREGKPARAPRERISREPMPPITPGDWQAQAEAYVARGRTRDAARLHEKHGSPAEASKLFEAGGDVKSALRAALAAKDMEAARRLAQALPAAEAKAQLERGEGWELLLELHVKGNAFDEAAKLYERARQFDQAALAWERAGKLGLARKAYERARDAAGAERVRTLEVQRLVERGDRLGAAQVLAQTGHRAEAVEILKVLPGTKAFRFLEQLKLKDEARALGEAELVKVTQEGAPGPRARWLDLLGRKAEAAQAWEAAGRKDRAYPLLEVAGDFAKAAAFAEASGHRDQAIRLFRRAGDDAAADRLEAMPPESPPPLPADEPAEEAADSAAGVETSSSGTPAV